MSNYSCGQRRGAEIQSHRAATAAGQSALVLAAAAVMEQLAADSSIRRVDLPSVSLHSVLCWRWWETHATWSREQLRKTSKK